MTLDRLPLGQEAIVAMLHEADPQRCRRLADLGFTPGARIVPELVSVGQASRAYRLRGALIALRRAQAQQVVVIG